MIKTIKRQRGQSYTKQDLQAIRQQKSIKRNGKASRILASLSQQVGA